MLTKADLEALSVLRIEDAIILYRAHRYSSAYYLAGYSVELGIKAVIAKAVVANVIPTKEFINKIYTHNLDTLLSLSGIKQQFDIDAKNDPALAAHWAIVSNWNEGTRYRTWSSVNAISIIQAIDDANSGVLQWVKKYW